MAGVAIHSVRQGASGSRAQDAALLGEPRIRAKQKGKQLASRKMWRYELACACDSPSRRWACVHGGGAGPAAGKAVGIYKI
jgi:hypothetical protein